MVTEALLVQAGAHVALGAAGPAPSPTSEKFVPPEVTPELLVAVAVPTVSLAPTLKVITAGFVPVRWKPWLRSVLSLKVYEPIPLADAVEVAVTRKVPPVLGS